MPSFILSFITSIFSKRILSIFSANHLVRSVPFVAVCVLAGIICYQNFWTGSQFLFGLNTIHSMEHTISKMHEKSIKQQFENNTLKQAIEQSNAIVDEWKTKTDNLIEEREKMSKQINDVRRQHSKEIQTILQDKVPQTCEEAFEYLKKGAKELQW